MNTPIIISIRLRAIVNNIRKDNVNHSIKVSRALLKDIRGDDIENINKKYSDMIKESFHLIFIYLCIGALDEAIEECEQVVINLRMTDKVAAYMFLHDNDSPLPYDVRERIACLV